MAFSMHSHSGEFCPGHAKDQLEEVILAAISHGMQTWAVTEHMPRESDEDLYPEEITAGHSTTTHPANHAAFLAEALRLREKYADRINILIGFEGEWIRPSYGPIINTLSTAPEVDFFIGSIHHVHGIPIDYDAAFYAKAVEKSGSEEKLFEDYLDGQLEMFDYVKPKMVGHFDLIRLLAEDPNAEWKTKGSGIIWEKVMRNLEKAKELGSFVEINTSGLRKGMTEPYPSRSICEAWRDMDGRFTLSDDSHGIAHVGTNYKRAFDYLESLGVKEVWTFERNNVDEKMKLVDKRVDMDKVRKSFKE